MSGHSKWATTKHKKAAIDAKRGKLFAKLIKNIEVAAKTGGDDPSGNPTLYDAIQKAKKSSVPNDNINRAIKRGGGKEAGGAAWESIMYEGYGPGGIAILVECLTDNKNRAAGDVRTAFGKNGGQLANPGSVAYLFSRKGQIIVDKTATTEDDLFMITAEAGAEDMQQVGEAFEVLCDTANLVKVREAIEKAGIEYESAESVFYPSAKTEVNLETAKKLIRLEDALEDSDDVQNIYMNMDISDDVAAELANE